MSKNRKQGEKKAQNDFESHEIAFKQQLHTFKRPQ